MLFKFGFFLVLLMGVMDNHKEKRQYERIFFSKDNQIPVYFSFAEEDEETLSGSIMNISEGGLCFALLENSGSIFKEGKRLFLKSVKEPLYLKEISNVEMEIKWISDDKILDHIGIGCEFVDPPESARAKLRQLIAAESANI